MNPLRILLIEDDTRLCHLLERGLQAEKHLVTTAQAGDVGLALALQDDFDMLITDVRLPILTGIEVCKILKQKKPNFPIIILTALGTTDDKVEGFDAGADDYLVKPFEMRELLVRIRALHKRYTFSSENQCLRLKYADIEMDLTAKEVYRADELISLTPKEFNLLRYFLENAERVLSRDEIAQNVWQVNFDTGTNFIDVYINYLRKKIDKNFSTKLIHTKTGMGFVLKNEA
jgi:DNA-binding response OmpR family regulator